MKMTLKGGTRKGQRRGRPTVSKAKANKASKRNQGVRAVRAAGKRKLPLGLKAKANRGQEVQAVRASTEPAAKRKRVSFANSLEQSPYDGGADQSRKDISIQDLIDAKQPQKGILKVKSTGVEVKNDENYQHPSADDQTGNDPTKTTNFDSAKPDRKRKDTFSIKNRPQFKKKRTIRVRRSTKEILMGMGKKERRAFIRELEMKTKPNFELGQSVTLLWNIVRSGKTAPDEKEKAIRELMAQCLGKLSKLVYCHGTGRAVQCLVALKRPEIRAQIFEELKPEILNMAKSKYAKYFVAKMLKYGTKEQRDVVISAFSGHSMELYRVAFAADLLERVYNEWATAEQRHAIVAEFYGAEFALFKNEHNLPPSQMSSISAIRAKFGEEKMAPILQNLDKVLAKAVSKVPMLKLTLTHKLLLEFLQGCSVEQRQAMVDSLKDQLPEICHSAEGSRAALLCIWHADVKERKAIVKSFKGLALRTCQDQFARRAMFGIFDTVDDTTLVNKIFTKEIADNIADVIYHKFGIWTLHYLVHPRDYRVFGKGLYELLKQGDPNPHSKKAPAVRYAELFECMREALFTFIVANMREVITNKTSAVLVLDALEVPSPSDPFTRTIADDQLDACLRAIADIAADEFIPHAPDGPSHIVQSGCARFVFRKLLQSDAQRADGHKLSDFLADLPGDQLASWTGMDCGCYALVEMYKSGSAKAQTALRKAISEKALENSNLAGAKALLDVFAGRVPSGPSPPSTRGPENLQPKRAFLSRNRRKQQIQLKREGGT